MKMSLFFLDRFTIICEGLLTYNCNKFCTIVVDETKTIGWFLLLLQIMYFEFDNDV